MVTPRSLRATLLGSCSIIFLAMCGSAPASAQMTSNVFNRVLMIEARGTRGTAFTIEVDRRQYLVTAKHVVKALKPEDSVALAVGGRWQALPVKVFRCADPVDIAVLVPPAQLTVAFDLPPTSAGLTLGQDVYFLGFPYGQIHSQLSPTPNVMPFAFMKKALFSAASEAAPGGRYFLDGHNNPGFSGGPVVFRVTGATGFEYRVAAVVTAFQGEFNDIYSPVELKPGEKVQSEELWEKDGKQYKLVPNGTVTRANTGIVHAWAISHAVELIKGHPIGPSIDPSTTGNTQKQ